MEAKDTILKSSILSRYYGEVHYPTLEEQAEVSFKAGLNQGIGGKESAWWWQDNNEDHLENLCSACLILIESHVLRRLIAEGRQTGIKEVVGWIKSKSEIDNLLMRRLSIHVIEWQAKLKEWGIET